MNNLFIVSTTSCILELLFPIITKFVTDKLTGENESDISLRKELLATKHKMGEISMVDQFAKFAKLQRQYNKLEDELRSRVNTLMMSKMKLKLSINYGLRILNAIAVAVLFFLYRWEPVAILPKDALWPLQGFFSWPCPLEDSISLTMWLAISRLAISVFK